MIEQLQNTEEKRQNYVSAIQHARNVKELQIVDFYELYKTRIKVSCIVILVISAILILIFVGSWLRQPFALLSAGISPFAEQTVIFTIDEYDLGVANAKWVSTKTLSGESVAVLLELQDNGIWEVTETKSLNSN